MKNWVLALAGVLCLAPVTPLAAQAVGSHPAAERGKRSILLSVDGGPEIGYWTRRSERTELGLDVGVSGIFGNRSTNLDLRVTPALKRYLAPSGALAPYGFVGVPLNYARQHYDNLGAPDQTTSLFGVGGVTGFGLEWLPVPQVSIGGHVGLRASYLHPGEGEDGVFSVGTMSSGIRVHLYS